MCAWGADANKGVHYKDSYSPVVSWTTAQLLLTLALIHSWHSRQIDFILAYPQADTHTTIIFIELPKKFVREISRETSLVINPAINHTF
jgi:hypothetical protein